MTARVGLIGASVVAATAVLQGTAVVVFRTPTRIVLASDSRVTTTNSLGVVTSSAMCKVRPAGRWWITFAGHMGGTAPPLDAFALTRRVLAPTESLTVAKAAFGSQVFPAIRTQVSQAGEAFAKAGYTDGQRLTQIVVAGTNANDPTLRVGVFVITLTTATPPTLMGSWLECPGAPGATGGLCPTGVLHLGASIVHDPLMTRLAAPRVPWVQRADSAAAHRLITEQSAATPTEVAPPIDVLEITASGARWIGRDRASLCGP